MISGLSAFLLGFAGLAVVPAPASASVITLCKGYSACEQAGMSSSGYAQASGKMYWRMYAGHNCTNYAAYRMIQSGLPNVRPWSGGGNATYWGTSMASITDQTPTVGSIAWWKAGVRPAGSAGHVAYVEKVVSPDEIIVSQDSWGGDFSWARITRTGGGWPSGFIHFNDASVVNTARPEISGTAKIGSTLSATAGTWNPSDVTIKYRWRADGQKLSGATAPTLLVTEELLGKRIKIRVTVSKPGYRKTGIASRATAAVTAGELSSTTPPSISGEPVVGSTLTAEPGAWDPTADSVSYQWLADGSPLEKADQQTLTLDQTLVGKAVSVRVTAHRDGYADANASSPATAEVAPRTLAVTVPASLTGTPRLGETLSVDPGAATPEATPKIRWLRDGVPISGPAARNTTYVPTPADLGSRLSTRVRFNRTGYPRTEIFTEETGLVRSTPTMAVEMVPGNDRLQLTATLTADGVDAVEGVLRIRSRGQLLSEVQLQDGSASTRLHDLREGRSSFRVVFRATPTVAKGVVVQRVRIR